MYTIEDLRNGKCAVINNGTLEELNAVLKAAFSNDNKKVTQIENNRSYYHKCNNNRKEWVCTNLNIPQKQSVKEFYKQLQPQFEVDKWYKEVNSFLYIKYSKEDDNYIYSNEVVCQVGFRQIKNESWTKGKTRQWILCEDLSEIQEYLPDNHPDKYFTIKDLFEGKVAVIDDGTKEELSEVLNYAFPDKNWNWGGVENYHKYFHKWTRDAKDNPDSDTLPKQSVKLFSNQIPKTMKQYLTRKQLIELHKADSCEDWKSKIKSILEHNILATDDTKFEIIQPMIDLANKRCNPKQKELLTKAGLKLIQEVAVCDSKDGDCIKVGENYYVNRGDFITVFIRYNINERLELRFIESKSYFLPCVKGELITEPLTLQIKIN